MKNIYLERPRGGLRSPSPRASTVAAGLVVALALSGCASARIYPATPSPASSAFRESVPGGRIVFRQYLDSDETQGALFVMNSDGSHRVQLTTPAVAEVDDDPDWSPDGSRIVFTRHLHQGDANETQQLVIMSADGSGQHPLTPGIPMLGTTVAGLDGAGSFSPDGTEITFVHSDGIIQNGEFEHSNVEVMNADGSNIRAVTKLAPYSGHCGGPHWSPDGQRIVYGFQDATIADPSLNRALFIANVVGPGTEQLTKWSLAADGVPDWSATNLIAFRTAPNADTGVGNFYTIHSDGTRLVNVSRLKDTEIGHKVSFSADGKWIVYGAKVHGVIQLTASTIDGGQSKVLTQAMLASSAPDWTPTSYTK